MARFLLVHGACHGAWCWRALSGALAALGHEARAIDLPGHGEDDTPIERITLDLYAQSVLAALDEPMIVVGHSMGGYPISRAAEIDPAQILRLVYLCAFVPRDGQSLIEMRRSAARQPILKALRKSEDGRSFSIIPEEARAVFYHDCPDDAVDEALARLCPEPILPSATPCPLGAHYAQVPRSYILCQQDGAIPPEFQRDMAREFPPEDVIEMPSAHAPFFSAPDRLAHLLDAIAAR